MATGGNAGRKGPGLIVVSWCLRAGSDVNGKVQTWRDYSRLKSSILWSFQSTRLNRPKALAPGRARTGFTGTMGKTKKNSLDTHKKNS